MDYISYLKFDLRLIKENIKYYVLGPAIVCVIFMFFGHSYNIAVSYLFFLLIVFATIPFSMQGNDKSTQMYFMFPCKVSSMVLGRYVYLISVTCTIFTINGAIISYLYKIHEFNNIEIVVMSLSGILSFLTCCIQYPIYYKFGVEKGRIASTITYLVPAFAIFVLPSFLVSSDYLVAEKIENSLNFIMNNAIILVTFSALNIMLIGYISYLISCRICVRKEV